MGYVEEIGGQRGIKPRWLQLVIASVRSGSPVYTIILHSSEIQTSSRDRATWRAPAGPNYASISRGNARDLYAGGKTSRPLPPASHLYASCRPPRLPRWAASALAPAVPRSVRRAGFPPRLGDTPLSLLARLAQPQVLVPAGYCFSLRQWPTTRVTCSCTTSGGRRCVALIVISATTSMGRSNNALLSPLDV